jgi:hypothetical protein
MATASFGSLPAPASWRPPGELEEPGGEPARPLNPGWASPRPAPRYGFAGEGAIVGGRHVQPVPGGQVAGAVEDGRQVTIASRVVRTR